MNDWDKFLIKSPEDHLHMLNLAPVVILYTQLSLPGVGARLLELNNLKEESHARENPFAIQHTSLNTMSSAPKKRDSLSMRPLKPFMCVYVL